MKLTDFERGVLISAGLVMRLHGCGVTSRELLNHTGLTGADCSELDDYDKENLQMIVDSEGIELKGL